MHTANTLLLTRGDIAKVLSLADCIDAVERGFLLHQQGKALPPAVLALHAPEGGFHVKGAGLRLGRDYVAVKINANFPANPARSGLPTIQGVVALYDADNGVPLAVMDSMEITSLRTAAATAEAARHLARADAASAAVIGCGVQGRVQLRALALVRKLGAAVAYDVDDTRAHAFATEMGRALGLPISVAGSAAEAARATDICVTCTTAKRPVLQAQDVRPGTFVAAVGADNPEKNEIAPDLFARATVVVDILEQCAEIGDLRHALAAGTITRAGVHAQLGEVVAGAKPGRRSADEITLFDSTGTALQDVAAAALAYERAVAAGIGLSIGFGA